MEVSVQKYQAFVETVECGSFTRAAEKMHYTQSGVSRMIRDLETEWKLTLLERGRGGVKVTAEGRALLPYAKSVCTEAERLRSRADELRGLRAGLIRIAALPDVSAGYLPNKLAGFLEKYPEIDFELLIGDRTEGEKRVLSGEADLGVISLPVSPELETEFLEQEPFLAVLPADWPEAGGGVFPVAGFLDHPFLLPEKEDGGEISALLESCGIAPRVRLRCGDEQAVLRLVERGLGASIFPAMAVVGEREGVAALPLDVPAYRSLALVLRSKKAASLAVKRFMEVLES